MYSIQSRQKLILYNVPNVPQNDPKNFTGVQNCSTCQEVVAQLGEANQGPTWICDQLWSNLGPKMSLTLASQAQNGMVQDESIPSTPRKETYLHLKWT